MLYGKDWKKMLPLIRTRTLVQIRTHAQKVFKKIASKGGGELAAAASAEAAAWTKQHQNQNQQPQSQTQTQTPRLSEKSGE